MALPIWVPTKNRFIPKMMRKTLFLIGLMGFCVVATAQTAFRVMEYNVENLFDTRHDTLKHDDEYLPGGLRGWNYERYSQKLAHIAQVVVGVGEWTPPALIALCEIENGHCLNDLTRYSQLRQLNYKIVHYESDDARGVDVALLYQAHRFRPIHSRPIRFVLPSGKTTRDILYACGALPNGDTLHLFVNHFPSRLGGELESEPNRLFVAAQLRAAVDSVQAVDADALIMIMGDFNDYPDNRSMLEVLGAQPVAGDSLPDGQLYNLTYALHQSGAIGSYRHDGQWGMLDQIVVSGALLNGSKATQIAADAAQVFAPDWLLEPDKPLGTKPFRTYVGMRFNGGYSDHLPVYVDVELHKK